MAPMFDVDQTAKGRLWIMPCPDGGRLLQDIECYRARAADRIVSMLTTDEAVALGLSDEARVCATVGIAFEQYPIQDFGLPEPAGFRTLVLRINAWLEAGEGVVVHCRAGIGRSGMVASGVLVVQGLTAAGAMKKVAQARGISIPDTVEQGRFVTTFAERF